MLSCLEQIYMAVSVSFGQCDLLKCTRPGKPVCYWKWWFSIAMLNYQRVNNFGFSTFRVSDNFEISTWLFHCFRKPASCPGKKQTNSFGHTHMSRNLGSITISHFQVIIQLCPQHFCRSQMSATKPLGWISEVNGLQWRLRFWMPTSHFQRQMLVRQCHEPAT